MRCKYCGWNNPTGKMVCEKCNTSLVALDNIEESNQKTVREISGLNVGNANRNERFESSKGVDGESSCIKCGYYLLAGAEICPQCGLPVAKPESVADERKTIMPFLRSGCTLEMLAGVDEKFSDDRRLLSFSGEEINLNRGNTDPENLTITTKKQAVLTHENRKWYIQDASELQTTFIRPGVKTEIKDGDILLLGDRRFRFKS